MDTPKIASKSPAQIELEGGKNYFFCTCGLSANQPYCDGAHKGTDFRPQMYTPDADETKWACNCKQSDKMPFCDGTHKAL